MPVKPLGQRSPLRMRYGGNVPMALGMHRSGSAATIPDAAFHHIENAVFSGPNVKSRPGQQRATNQVTGPIEGMCDVSDIGAAVAAADGLGALPAAYGALRKTTGGTPATTLYDFNNPTDTTVNVRDETEAGDHTIIRSIDSVLYIGTIEVAGVPSIPAKIKTGSPASRPTALLTSLITGTEAGSWLFSGFVKYGGTVHVGYGSVPGSGADASTAKVYTLSGAVLTLSDDSGRLRGYPFLVPFGSDLYAVYTPLNFGSSTDMLLRKKSGGVWSTATASVVAGFFPTAAVEFMGKLYMGGVIYNVPAGTFSSWAIVSWDGATLATARVPAGGLSSSPMALAASATKLYYTWREPGGDGEIGSFDGVTWTDSVVSLTTIRGSSGFPIRELFMEVGKLCIGLTADSKLYYQDEASIATGPWTTLDAPSGYGLFTTGMAAANTALVGAH